MQSEQMIGWIWTERSLNKVDVGVQEIDFWWLDHSRFY
jgi:hypothetical protein